MVKMIEIIPNKERDKKALYLGLITTYFEQIQLIQKQSTIKEKQKKEE